MGEALGTPTGESPVAVERGVGLVTDPLRDLPNDFSLVVDFRPPEVTIGAVFLVSRRDVKVELQRVESQFVDDALRFVSTRDRVSFVLGMTVTVDSDRIPVLAAEELLRRDVEQLTRDVVQSEFDAGNRGYVLSTDRTSPDIFWTIYSYNRSISSGFSLTTNGLSRSIISGSAPPQ